MVSATSFHRRVFGAVGLTLAVGLAIVAVDGLSANASAAPVGLGGASGFAVLGYSTVTNTGPSVISGDLGLNAGSSVTGFPPGTVINGATYVADGVSLQARNDATNAYTTAANQTPSTVGPVELGGTTLIPDLYSSGGALQITGDLTLDAQNDPNAVWVFQSASTLITASNSRVQFINGGNPCNVYWQVASSATLGNSSTFLGTLLAHDSVAAETSATITGRLIALNGAVTLDTNTVSSTSCAPATVVALPSPTPSATPSASPVAAAPLPPKELLARTGTDAPVPLIASSMLLAAGVGLLLWRRRLRKSA